MSDDVVIAFEDFQKFFYVAYCITTHKSQAKTIREPYTIHEWDKMDRRLRYVALSRATCCEHINIIQYNIIMLIQNIIIFYIYNE
jgi:hypothetical protein